MAIIKEILSMPEQEKLSVRNNNAAFLSASMPIGAILPFGGATAPTGTLFADGSAVSRTTYSNLFATIGTAYGSGDGSTTFNLPDMRYRVPVGLDLTQTEFNAIGKTGGSPTHTLTKAEMPSHAHKSSESAGYFALGGTASATSPLLGQGNRTDLQALNTSLVGGDQPHNNLQPYVTTNYIIVYAGGVSQAQIDASLQGAKDYADSQDVINLASAKSYTNSSVALKQDKTITDTGDYFTATDVNGALQEVGASLVDSDAHLADTANPHNTTKAQVGLGNVDNTADADKQVSTAQQIAIDNAITTSGTNADDKITTHNTSSAAHADIRDTITLPTVTASGANLSLTDLALHKNFIDVTVKGITTETGTGTKAPDNPYTISGVTPTKVTVGGVDYPIATSAPLYSLPDGTVDTYNVLTGLETHTIKERTLSGLENWSLRTELTSNYHGYVFRLDGSNGSMPTTATNTRSTHFNPVIGFPLLTETGTSGIRLSTETMLQILIYPRTSLGILETDSNDTILSKFKAWLAAQNSAETPVRVAYKLATPTTTQHTPQVIPQSSLSTIITPDYGTVSVAYYQNLASAIDLKANMTDTFKLVIGTFATRPTVLTRPTLYLSTDIAVGNANRITISIDGTTWYQV